MIGKKLSTVLEEFPEEIQTGINALSQGISIFSTDLRLIFFNSTFQEILDLPDSLLANNPHFDDLIRFNAERGEYGDIDIEAKVQEMHKLAVDFKSHQFIRKTHSGLTIEIKGVPITGGGFVTTYTDVTELVKAREKFEEASQRFKDFTEAASDWYWETDADYKFTFFSERFEKVLGLPAASMLGTKRGELAVDQGDEKWIKHNEVTKRREPFDDFEYELKSENKLWGTRFCSVSGRPVYDANGEFLGYRGVGKEITDKVLAERERERNLADQIILAEILELSLSGRPLNEILDKVLNIIFENNRRGFEKKGCIFLANENEQKLKMAAFIGISDDIIRKCKFVEYGKCLCGKAAIGKGITFKPHIDEDHEYTFPGMSPHGHYCVPIIQDKQLLGLLNLYIDDGHEQTDDEISFLTSIANTMAGIITRWQTQQDLRRLSQAIEQNPAAILITDVSGRINYVNKAFTDTSGYSQEEVMGQTPRLFKSGVTSSGEYENLWKVISSGNVWNGVFHNKTKSGRRIWERATIVPIKNRRGKVVSYVGIKENITASKQQEEEQERLERELQQAQKMEAIGQLAGGIAHEINTPTQYVSDNLLFLKETWDDLKELHALYEQMTKNLNTSEEAKKLVNEIQELRDRIDFDDLNEDVIEALEDAVEGTTQISRIVKAMKDFSHPGQKEMVMADINQAIRSTSTVCKNEWKYLAKIKFNLDENMPQIQCLPGELNQVFLNMIVNAAHAIEERNKLEQKNQIRTITIKTSTSAKYAHIQIQDEGNGIPKKAQDKIFNPFFTTKIVGKGTGQGLSISHDVIVNKHKGRVWFETKEGEGSTFHISIPIEATSDDVGGIKDEK